MTVGHSAHDRLCALWGAVTRFDGYREEVASVSLLQVRLDQAIQNAIDARGTGWTRPKKANNGRVMSWRIPHATTADVEICVWPHNEGYVITDTNPGSKLHVREPDATTAVHLAEELAGVLQPQ